MSQQIQISGGAKVRALEGVITGTSGVLSSVPLGAANGVATLDSGGKVPVSQLPSSVVTYLGTWNAATNTPTLVNGTGDAGDMYICNVAGTVNFGAGPVVFVVGDWVLYGSGTWQKSSGQNGTVTSVGASITGSAIGITGSPITTAGTLAFAFAGTNLEYVNGAGNLTTFPILTGYVPYTGATANVDLGVYDLTADLITGATGSFASNGGSDTFAINHSSGSGIALNITKGGNGEGLYINKTSGTGNAATIVGTLEATTLVKSGGTSSQFLKADGTVDSNTYALDSAVVHLAGTETITGAKTFSGYTTFTSTVDITSGLTFSNSGFTLVLQPPTLSVNRTVTLPNGTGTLALTSDISYPVTSVFGRTGAIVATEGDYSLTQLSDVTITSPTTNQVLKYNGTAWINDTDANTGTVTSVGLSAPTGFSVTGSPVTSSGTLALAFASGYSLPTTVKQSNWDDAYTFVAAFPTQTGNAGKYLTTDGSVLSWATNPLGTVTSVGLSSATSGVTIGSTPITTSGTITLAIATATTSQNGLLSSTDWTTFNGKQTALSGTGFVKISGTTISYDNSTYYLNSNPSAFIALTALSSSATGLTYTNTTGVFSLTAGYSIPTTASQATWTTAYNDSIISAAVTGTSTKTLTLNQQDGGTITASWTDISTDAVTSVFGRTGAIVATSGDYTTAQVTESGNLYFTDSRARLALSFVAGSGAYNSTTGVITIPTNNNQITNGAGYTTNVGTVTSVAATGGTGISITGSPITTSGTITITNTAPDQVVALTASTGISVSGTYPNFTITNTSPSSGGTVTSVAALTIGTTGTDVSSTVANSTTTPVITLNVPTASATNRGALSSADWTTFNNKQSALTNPVTGTGTTNYLPKFTGASTIGNSAITDDGTTVTLVSRALSGTSASFNGNLTNTSSNFQTYGSTSFGASTWGLSIGNGGASANYYRANDHYFQNGAGTQTLQIASTGAATFSSSVYSSGSLQVAPTTGTGMIGVGDNFGGNMNAGIYRGGLGVTTSGNYLNIGGYDGVVVTTGNAALGSQTVRLTLASTGAATFSSGIATLGYTASTSYAALFNGLVGIGTNSPSVLLDIQKSSTGGSTGEYPTIRVKNTNTDITGTNNSFADIRVVSLNGTFDGQIAAVANASDTYMRVGTLTNHPTTIWTNSVERMRITSAGATTFTGSVTATSFFESSSIKGKDIIATNPLLALDIDVIKYTRKSDESKDIRYGYSAEQIHSLMPELTDKDVTAVKYLDVHTILIANLQKEIRELKAKINN